MKNYVWIALFFHMCKNSDSVCPKHDYQDTATSCVSCAAVGGYSLRCLAWNSATCETCPMGKYSLLNGTINKCVNCPKGTFSNTTGSTACITCPDLTYASTTGSTACLPCQTCSTIGKFKSECNATHSGTCAQCTHIPTV